eukprot:3763284-Pyramimonas_sp.AAC.1
MGGSAPPCRRFEASPLHSRQGFLPPPSDHRSTDPDPLLRGLGPAGRLTHPGGDIRCSPRASWGLPPLG